MQHELAGSSSEERLTHRVSVGDLAACREIVERYGGEVFRLGYLLTGDAPRAAELTADTLIDRLATLDVDAGPGDLRESLLCDLAARYLHAPVEEAQPESRIVSFPRDVGQRRFSVDDARSRLRHALDRLTAAERAFLLLRLVGGIDGRRATELSAVNDDRRDELIARLTDVADVANRQELSSTLVALAVEAPRVDLWELVEEPVSERLAARKRRAQLFTAGIVFVAVALVVALTAAIIGNPWASSPDPAPQAAAVDEIDSDGSGSDAPLLPTPALAPTATPTPAAHVAEELFLLQTRGVPEFRRVSTGESNALVPLIDPGEGLVEAHEPVISPDGEHIATVWYRQRGAEVRGLVRLYASDFSTLVWEAEMTRSTATPTGGSRQPFLLIPAINHDTIWIAEHYWDRSEPVQLHALDRRDGRAQQTITTTLPGFAAHDIRLIAAPELGTVHLFTITREEPPMVGQLQMVYLSYSADGERLHAKTLTDLAASRIFFLYSARLTPDGRWLYGIEYTQSRREVAVHFFDLLHGVVDRRVVVPFQPRANPMTYQYATSHDGSRLYILSHVTREVAIVDLREHRLEALIPLDATMPGSETIDTVYIADERMQLSPDGRHIYAIAPSTDGSSRPAGIWEIDVRTWQVTRRLAPERVPQALLLGEDGRTLFIHEGRATTSRTTTSYWSLDLETGSLQRFLPDLTGRVELTSPTQLYKDVYGRSPAVDDRVPTDLPPGPTLAGMEFDVEPERIASGEHVDLEVRFIDPFSGESATTDPDLRYVPPASVQIMLEQQAGGQVVVVDLGQVGPARYAGTAQLGGDGWWTVRAVVTWPESGPAARELLLGERIRVDAPPVVSQSLSVATGWNH